MELNKTINLLETGIVVVTMGLSNGHQQKSKYAGKDLKVGDKVVVCFGKDQFDVLPVLEVNLWPSLEETAGYLIVQKVNTEAFDKAKVERDMGADLVRTALWSKERKQAMADLAKDFEKDEQGSEAMAEAGKCFEPKEQSNPTSDELAEGLIKILASLFGTGRHMQIYNKYISVMSRDVLWRKRDGKNCKCEIPSNDRLSLW